jgi:hypothetical protein
VNQLINQTEQINLIDHVIFDIKYLIKIQLCFDGKSIDNKYSISNLFPPKPMQALHNI